MKRFFSEREEVSFNLEIGYEARSCLASLKLAQINKIFKLLRKPLETDEKVNIIDYNWHVDGILKNSQSYNKDP